MTTLSDVDFVVGDVVRMREHPKNLAMFPDYVGQTAVVTRTYGSSPILMHVRWVGDGIDDGSYLCWRFELVEPRSQWELVDCG